MSDVMGDFPFPLGGEDAEAGAVVAPALVRDIALDTDGDLYITAGDAALVSEAAAIAQNLTIGLALILGEWFLDEEIGIDYFGSIFVKNPNLVLVRELFREEIISTPGVNELLFLDLVLDPATRTLRPRWRVSSDFGELTSEVV